MSVRVTSDTKTIQGYFHEKLNKLAEAIPSREEDVRRLALKLGFEYNPSTNYCRANNSAGNSEGTKCMLHDFCLEKSPTECEALLKKALIDAKLKDVAEKFFPQEQGMESTSSGSGSESSAVCSTSKGQGLGSTNGGSKRDSPAVCSASKVTDVLGNIYLGDLSRKIGVEWKTLGNELGLNKAKIDHITEDKSNAIDRIFDMLLQWRQSFYGDKRKMVEKLCDALRSCDRSDLSDEVKADAGIC